MLRLTCTLANLKKDQKVLLLVAQVLSHSVLPCELGLQIMYLDNKPLVILLVLVLQGQELLGIANLIRG